MRPTVALALAALALTACSERRAPAKDTPAAAAPAPAPADEPLAAQLERVESAFPPSSPFGPPADLHGLRREGDRIHFPPLPRFAVFTILEDAWGPNIGETFIPESLHQTRWASPDNQQCALMEEDPIPKDDDALRWANVRFVPCSSLPPDHRPH